MKHFIKKYKRNIVGSLTGFDRIVLRGTLRMLSFELGMLNFLQRTGVLLKNFGEYVEEQSKILKKSTIKKAVEENRSIIYLTSCKTRKEPIARKIVEEEKITSGLICVLKCVEPCVSYEIFKNKESKKLELKSRNRQCLHYYHYWIDPIFGFMSARIQTWFPFSIQVCLNGREYLANQMKQQNLFHIKEDNCFTYISDFDQAQKLMTSMLELPWPEHLNQIANQLNPTHEQIFSKCKQEYYWSVHQSEMATDLVFDSSRNLDLKYEKLVRGAMTNFSSPDVMNFLGRTLNGNFNTVI